MMKKKRPAKTSRPLIPSSHHRQEGLAKPAPPSPQETRPAPSRSSQMHERKSYSPEPELKESLNKLLRLSEQSLKSIRGNPDQEPPAFYDKEAKQSQLDAWQREAFESLLADEHVIVDAPTTAGKTRIVETFFELRRQDPNFRAVYTTPVKSLSYDKLREFRERFGEDQVGIATGDLKDRLDAPIVVATLESYRNSLLGVEPDLKRSLVVFDEYHFMQDQGRGSAWEEAIILTPKSSQLLLLSASVANPEDFCRWIQELTRKNTRLIQITERPVPLVNLVYYQGHWLHQEVLEPHLASLRRPMRSGEPLPADLLAERLTVLEELSLTPALLYAGRRLACEDLAESLQWKLKPLHKDKSDALRKRLETDPEALALCPTTLRRMLEVYGLGYHHSGIAAPTRRLIEQLVKEGLLRFCVATMGLSIGINFSVRSTLISDFTRPSSQGFIPYPPSEILQMRGRAGRRGRDRFGFSLWPSINYWLRFGKVERETCRSQLKAEPSTYLSLVGRGFPVRDLEHFYERSFFRVIEKKAAMSLIRSQTLKKKLACEQLPCASPAAAFASFQQCEASSLCQNCPWQEACHQHIAKIYPNPLSSLQVHLLQVHALDAEEKLSPFGAAARFFPQDGGLFLASYLVKGKIKSRHLLQALELMASFCLSSYKKIKRKNGYNFPFIRKEIEAELLVYYPPQLFPKHYETDAQTQTQHFREFNPLAASLIHDWALGMNWEELVREYAEEGFGQGDIMALIYRAASLLQSLDQSRIWSDTEEVRELRKQLLREPLTLELDE